VINGSTFSAATVLIAGAGNIGSHLAPLLARAGVGVLRLVDRDRVEEKNLKTQDFQPADVGRFKAEALADRLRRDFPKVRIEARPVDLEDLPLADARVSLVLGALDSRRARQLLISELAWPLGVPVVDGGVGEGLVGRVQVFVPSATAACLECTWSGDDYRQLAAEYPCSPGARAEAPPTISPAFAGAVVAGIMTAEAVRILSGAAPVESQEVAFDLTHRRFLVTRLRRAPRCRFDHETVSELLRVEARTVGDVLAAIKGRFGVTPVHVERRGRGERFLTPEHLRPHASEPLTALGFGSGDWLRVRSAERSVFLAFVNDPGGLCS
jgi:molybdopterin/thiamine biosynthesis adenylyltransferase